MTPERSSRLLRHSFHTCGPCLSILISSRSATAALASLLRSPLCQGRRCDQPGDPPNSRPSASRGMAPVHQVQELGERYAPAQIGPRVGRPWRGLRVDRSLVAPYFEKRANGLPWSPFASIGDAPTSSGLAPCRCARPRRRVPLAI
jgi:hypothetical protein